VYQNISESISCFMFTKHAYADKTPWTLASKNPERLFILWSSVIDGYSVSSAATHT
jgi:hypothetical protein